jgi:hypothetical protein
MHNEANPVALGFSAGDKLPDGSCMMVTAESGPQEVILTAIDRITSVPRVRIVTEKNSEILASQPPAVDVQDRTVQVIRIR